MLFAGMIKHKGKNIVFLDISGSEDIEESMRTGDQAKALIKEMPLNSVLFLTDVTDAHFNHIASDYMKEFSTHITPYIKASAMVGASGVRGVIRMAMSRASNREILNFNNREAAEDWLAAQDR